MEFLKSNCEAAQPDTAWRAKRGFRPPEQVSGTMRAQGDPENPLAKQGGRSHSTLTDLRSPKQSENLESLSINMPSSQISDKNLKQKHKEN